MEKVISQIIRFRIPILAALIAFTVFMSFMAAKVEVDPAVESMILETDPTKQSYERFKDIFGHDEFGVVLYYDKNLFTVQVLETLGRISEAIEYLKVDLPASEKLGTPARTVSPIRDVFSITKADRIVGREWGMEIDKLIPEIPETGPELAALREVVLGEDLYEGMLINKAGDTSAILFVIETGFDDNDTRKIVEDSVKTIIDAELAGLPGEYRYLGTPIAKTHMIELTNRDSKTFFPLSILSICFFLYLIFRSVRGILLPLISVVLALVWTLGLLVLTGQKFTVTTTTIIPLIQVYGVATVIHIFSHLSEGLERQTDKVKALIHTCGYISIPCFLTSLTTAIGFSSNSVSEILPVRVAGLMTAFGVMCTYVIAFTVVPIALYYLPAKTQQKRYQEGLVNRFMTRFLIGISRFNRTYPKQILVVWVIIGLAGILGLVNLKVETQTINFLQKDDPIRAGYDFTEKHLGGINVIEVLVECEGQDCMLEPKALSAMDRLNGYIVSRHPEVSKSSGFVDIVKKMNQAMHEGDPAHLTVPESRELLAQYMLLFTGDIGNYLSENGDKARLTVRVDTMPSPRLRAIIAEIDGFFASELPEGYSGKGTGGAVLYANMVDTLVEGQMKSLGLAFFFILICMSFILRSFKVGLLSMIPNMIPIFFNFGLMGLTGITLNISTAMIASIAIGIAVDNTTHFLWRVNREFQLDGDYNASMERTITSVGRPMCYTAVIIIFGFLIICAGSFVPNIHFGMLCGITMFSAALADLTLTPVIILLFKPLKRHKNVRPLYES